MLDPRSSVASVTKSTALLLDWRWQEAAGEVSPSNNTHGHYHPGHKRTETIRHVHTDTTGFINAHAHICIHTHAHTDVVAHSSRRPVARCLSTARNLLRGRGRARLVTGEAIINLSTNQSNQQSKTSKQSINQSIDQSAKQSNGQTDR